MVHEYSRRFYDFIHFLRSHRLSKPTKIILCQEDIDYLAQKMPRYLVLKGFLPIFFEKSPTFLKRRLLRRKVCHLFILVTPLGPVTSSLFQLCYLLWPVKILNKWAYFHLYLTRLYNLLFCLRINGLKKLRKSRESNLVREASAILVLIFFRETISF